MTPRYGDDRVGNFLTVHKDFSQDDSTFFVRMVNRWRLEPGERVGDKFRPKQPITYYIDPNGARSVPRGDEGRRRGLERGLRGRRLGRRHPRAGPARPTPMPDDIRYATLRWNVSDQPGYGAIGPSTVDPRTGEVLDADILFESTMFGELPNTWRNVSVPITAARRVRAGARRRRVRAEGATGSSSRASRRLRGTGRDCSRPRWSRAASIGARTIRCRRTSSTQAVKWVTMHEVGHTLGLQHNFRSLGEHAVRASCTTRALGRQRTGCTAR